MSFFRIATLFLLLLPLASGLANSQVAVTPTEAGFDFSKGSIPPIPVMSDEHIASMTNGVHFDVYYNHGIKSNVAIYAINTGRKQLVLSPDKHKAILDDLVRRKFTVIVADFKDKQLKGIELEKYVVQLTADARAMADGVLHPSSIIRPALVPRQATVSKTETYSNNYFTLMPGFTVERDVTWFRYGDIPAPFRQEIARQLGKPSSEAAAGTVNTYDIIYPVYGSAVGVLAHYGSDEKGHQDYYPLETMYLVMAFAFKNLAIVHQQYFNDPVGGYHKGYDYYGDQFSLAFIRHLKGQAEKYHLDQQKICGFGCSKGSEVPGMLLNKLRAAPQYRHVKASFKKTALSEKEMTIPSPYADLPTEIACAILGAGIANSDLGNDHLMPWDNEPAKHISPFFLYADHRADTRKATINTVAKARAKGVVVETAELSSHTWPFGEAYDQASAFADRFLQPNY